MLLRIVRAPLVNAVENIGYPPGRTPLDSPSLSTSEQELQVLGAETIHSNFIVVDRPSNHSGLLLLQRNHTRLYAVLDTQTGDDTGSLLSDTVASISGLPLGGGIPPARY